MQLDNGGGLLLTLLCQVIFLILPISFVIFCNKKKYSSGRESMSVKTSGDEGRINSKEKKKSKDHLKLNEKCKNRKLVSKEPSSPRIPTVKGMVCTNDPNYQTLAGLANDVAFGQAVTDQKKYAGTHDPSHQTMAALNDDDIFYSKPGNNIPMAGTSDLNYQTLAGLDNFAIFGNSKETKRKDVTPMAPTSDPNYQTLAYLTNDIFKENQPVVPKRPEYHTVVNTHDPNYQTLANLNADAIFGPKRDQAELDFFTY